MAMMLAVRMEIPVVIEATALHEGAELEDGLGALPAPPCVGEVEAVVDERSTGALDDACRDGRTGQQQQVVVHQVLEPRAALVRALGQC